MYYRVGFLVGALVASFLVAAPLQANFLGQTCEGCRGKSGIASSALAPPPCLGTAGTVAGDWEISVSADVYDGTCLPQSSDGIEYCVGQPCQSTVSYSWGSQVANSGLGIGYYKANGVRQPPSQFLFPDGDPWKDGQFGTVAFGPGNSPDLACGTKLSFFIEGNKCGPFKAEVYGYCGPCGTPPYSL